MYVFINYAILRVIMRQVVVETKEIGEQLRKEKGTELRVHLFEESLSRPANN